LDKISTNLPKSGQTGAFFAIQESSGRPSNTGKQSSDMISGEATLLRGAVAPQGSWRGRRPPVQELAEAMLRGDVGEAADLADRFLARTRSRVAVFADLLQPAQYEVGERWYRGRASSGDEHRAALVLQRLVSILDPTPARAQVATTTRCLLAVMPGEQ